MRTMSSWGWAVLSFGLSKAPTTNHARTHLRQKWILSLQLVYLFQETANPSIWMAVCMQWKISFHSPQLINEIKCIIYVECLSNCKRTFNAFPYSYNISKNKSTRQCTTVISDGLNMKCISTVTVAKIKTSSWLPRTGLTPINTRVHMFVSNLIVRKQSNERNSFHKPKRSSCTDKLSFIHHKNYVGKMMHFP